MNWGEITLSQYTDILDIYKDDTLDESDKIIEVCKVLFDVDLLKQPLTEYGKYISQLDFLKTKMPKVYLPDTYEINGTKYRFTKDVGDITVAQYYDFMAISKDGNEVGNYHNLMSCFLIPEGKTYGEGYNIQSVKDDILDLPMPIADAFSDFWQRASKRLMKVFLSYLQLQALKMPRKKRKMIMPKIREIRRMTTGVFFH